MNLKPILRKRNIAFFCLIVIIIILVLNDFLDRNYMIISKVTKTEEKIQPYSHGKKVILLWTKFWDIPWSAMMKDSCECLITENRSLLPYANMVVFHWIDTNFHDLPIKYAGQKWVWFLIESPANTHRKAGLQNFQKYIDCWATYRSDSDFYRPYGCLHTLLPAHHPLVENRNSTYHLDSLSKAFKKKRKSIAWLVSACSAESKREKYVEELSKYISVDIYGRCGMNCDDKPLPCYEYLAENYFFYLSFENSLCKEYFTEKIFNIFPYNLVPIVMGSADYEKLFPKNSLINVADYQSPKDLAEHLYMVADDESLYNSFFKWKFNYTRNETLCQSLGCSMCSAIEKGYQCRGSNQNLVDWWYDDGNCRTWYDL